MSMSSLTSLYVGDLSKEVTEADLATIFGGPDGQFVSSVRLCRDNVTQNSLGYSYVNFFTAENAADAILQYNGYVLKGKPIRVCFSERDNSKRRSGEANICVKDIPKTEDIAKKLRAAFIPYGHISSFKVSTDKTGAFLNYGFVNFERKEEAVAALEAASRREILIDGIPVSAEPYVSSAQRNKASPLFTNIYVKNIPTHWDNAALNNFYSRFGPIVSAVVAVDPNNQGANKGFGYVNFESHESAALAISETNGLEVEDKKLSAYKHLAKEERQRVNREIIAQNRLEKLQRYASCNLYIKRLPEDITDEKLREAFSVFGNIVSSKVQVNPANGVPTGVGYVCFSTAEEASRAIEQSTNNHILDKILYVTHHQHKQARDNSRLRHPNHFVRMAPVYNFPPIGAPVYPLPPYHQPRRFNHNGGRKIRQHNSKTRRPRTHKHDIGFAQKVQQITDENEKKQFLGEALYPLVSQIDPEHAPKITGMLLEMDVSEVIALCENRQDLFTQVAEAQNVLKNSPDEPI